MSAAKNNDALDQRVCEFLGIPPKREWVVGTPPEANGDSGSIAMTKRKGMEGPTLYDEWEAWEMVTYPHVSSDWAAFGLAWEKLNGLGYLVDFLQVSEVRSDPLDSGARIKRIDYCGKMHWAEDSRKALCFAVAELDARLLDARLREGSV